MINSKNDHAWQQLLALYPIEHSIAQQGYYCIRAQQINQFREARLMTKFDHRSQLPKLFQQHNFSILPISRGNYLLGTYEIFADFNQDKQQIHDIQFPVHLQSLNYQAINSEAMAINCAFVAKILHHFTGETDLVPTVNGRMGSGQFSFNINTNLGEKTVDVDNAQLEIDAGFEGKHALYLIEAKNYIASNFLIRQLYYPYRLWQAKINKPVRNLFLTYSNGIFELREYVFTQPDHYNSIQLHRHERYTLVSMYLDEAQVLCYIQQVKPVLEPALPFPQADNFPRVINLCELLLQRRSMTKEEITQNYDFDARQTDYYVNAARYLGLVDLYKDQTTAQICCVLSPLGQKIFALNLAQRQLEFIKLILEHQVFKLSLKRYIEEQAMPSKAQIVAIMQVCALHNIQSETTYMRRASTVIAWIDWIVGLIKYESA